MPLNVLILGAGINGAAIARELTLNGISVTVVDAGDLARGATAYSSRLIHGGLRYLEYGEFDLVRESLHERTNWLQYGADFVQPMRFVVPVRNRFGGLWNAIGNFLHLPKFLRAGPTKGGRGFWTVMLGLKFYDLYAQDKNLPRSRGLLSNGRLPLAEHAARWQCEYSDGQILFPERFTVGLFQDAVQAARENGSDFELYPYHHAEFHGRTAILRTSRTNEEVRSFTPDLIINASGAWVDQTLKNLHIDSKQLLAGTKGSHFVTSHAGLCAALREPTGREPRAVYAEASDGRPFFILPFLDRVLVGTTDIPFHGDPAAAVTEPSELEYLACSVAALFPHLNFTIADIEQHYCGVRPLPYVGPSSPSAITRRHWVERSANSAVPLYSIIGGKLTTCRSLAEEVAAMVRNEFSQTSATNQSSRTRPLHDATKPLRVHEPHAKMLIGTTWSLPAVQHVIETEWVTHLEDLVERRLMLVFDKTLRRATLVQLAQLLAHAGKLPADAIEQEVEQVTATLRRRYGKTVE